MSRRKNTGTSRLKMDFALKHAMLSIICTTFYLRHEQQLYKTSSTLNMNSTGYQNAKDCISSNSILWDWFIRTVCTEITPRESPAHQDFFDYRTKMTVKCVLCDWQKHTYEANNYICYEHLRGSHKHALAKSMLQLHQTDSLPGCTCHEDNACPFDTVTYDEAEVYATDYVLQRLRDGFVITSDDDTQDPRTINSALDEMIQNFNMAKDNGSRILLFRLNIYTEDKKRRMLDDFRYLFDDIQYNHAQ